MNDFKTQNPDQMDIYNDSDAFDQEQQELWHQIVHKRKQKIRLEKAISEQEDELEKLLPSIVLGSLIEEIESMEDILKLEIVK